MRITPDTNVLVRAIVIDNERQAATARRELARSEIVVVGTTVLCELCWVLGRAYKFKNDEIGRAILMLIDSANVASDRPAVDAGLAMLAEGGDFADGVIAHEGEKLGANTFVSFDKDAVAMLEKRGSKAKLLS